MILPIDKMLQVETSLNMSIMIPVARLKGKILQVLTILSMPIVIYGICFSRVHFHFKQTQTISNMLKIDRLQDEIVQF